MPAAWEPDFTVVPLWTGTPSWIGEAPEPTDGPDLGDSDGDLLPNWFEVWLGTSPGNPDSDSDGISDYDELFLTGTNPKHWDSDGDGISDHDAWYGCWAVNHNDVGFGVAVYDWDGDGLYNHEDPFPFDPNNDAGSEWMDSDGDGVEDGSDSHPWDSSLWDDWDFNGINDDEEMPESSDSDGDGVADDSDSHPWDSLLWNDWNFNDVNDNEEFPDPYTDDNDGDGYVDADDSHPWDSSLWNDFDYNNINDHEETDGEYDPTIEDGDGDGVVDASDSHPLDPDLWSDYDEDGLNAEEEIQLGTNPYMADTDGDGLTDLEEVNVYLTNPLNPDTDGDGLTDSEELRLQPTSNPLNAHSLSQAADFGDLYTDWQMNDTTDTDGDGIPDRIEELYGRWLDPNNPHDAGWDADGDGVTNLEAYQNGWVIRTAINPLDRDGDGITDVQEDHWNSIHPGIFSKFRFSDAVEDADQDGLMNYAEIMQGSDPGVADSLYPGVTDLTVWAWTRSRDQVWMHEPLTFLTPAAALAASNAWDWFAEGDANENGIPDGLDAFITALAADGLKGRVSADDFDGDGMSDVWEWRYREALDPMDHRDAGVPGQAIPGPPMPPNYEDFTDAGTGMVDYASFSTAESDYQTELAAYQALGYHRIDPDDDGLCNLHEFQLRTNPLLADSDGDGVPDGIEVLHGGDPADSQVIPPLVLAVVSGHGQTVEVGQVTAQPLKVRVTSAGIPQSGRTIAFTASAGSLLALGGSPAATAQTNAQGEAQINWQAPMQSGLATITAAGAGAASPVAFNLASAFPVLEMHVVSGRGQSVEVGKVAGEAITAQVSRGMLSPAGLWVTFTPTPGTGKVGVTSNGPWVPSLTLETNEQGQASVFLRAPSFSGTFGLDITARVAVADTSPGPVELVTYITNPGSNPPGGPIGPPGLNPGHRANGLILFASERFIEGKFNGLAGTGTVVNDQTSTSQVQEWVKYEDPPQHDGWDGDLDADNDPDDPGDPRDENLQLRPRLRHLVDQGTPGAELETWDEESSIPGEETIASFNQGYYNATNKIDKMKGVPEGRWELQTQNGAFEPNELLAGLQSIKWGFEDGNGWLPGLHGWMGDGAYGILTKTAVTSHGVGSVSGTIPPTGGNSTNQPWSLTVRDILHQRRQIRVQSNRVITQQEGAQSVSFIVLQTTKGKKAPNGTDLAPVIEAKGSVTFTIPVGENVATQVETSGAATTMIRPIPYVDLNALGLGPPPLSNTISQAIELIPPLETVAPNESVELSVHSTEFVVDYDRDGKLSSEDTRPKDLATQGAYNIAGAFQEKGAIVWANLDHDEENFASGKPIPDTIRFWHNGLDFEASDEDFVIRNGERTIAPYLEGYEAPPADKIRSPCPDVAPIKLGRLQFLPADCKVLLRVARPEDVRAFHFYKRIPDFAKGDSEETAIWGAVGPGAVWANKDHVVDSRTIDLTKWVNENAPSYEGHESTRRTEDAPFVFGIEAMLYKGMKYDFSAGTGGEEFDGNLDFKLILKDAQGQETEIDQFRLTCLRLPAFPGAQGFGKWSQGGRGGEVYKVTNLSDSASTPGSLRYGIENRELLPNAAFPSTMRYKPRTIVFDVGGQITLLDQGKIDSNNNPIRGLRIESRGAITIAGQTAPSSGITLTNDVFSINGSPSATGKSINRANDVVIRYMRVRRATEGIPNGTDPPPGADAFTVYSASRVIVDHCSFNGGLDGAFDIVQKNDPVNAQPEMDVTAQWCFIHHTLEGHSKGMLLRGKFGARYSVLNSYLGHNAERNATVGWLSGAGPGNDVGKRLFIELSDNVIYDWKNSDRVAGTTQNESEGLHVQFISNHYKRGDSDGSGTSYAFKFNTPSGDNAYFSLNRMDGTLWATPTYFILQAANASYRTEPFVTDYISIGHANDARDRVVTHAGASRIRDVADTAYASEVQTGTQGTWYTMTNSIPSALRQTYSAASHPSGYGDADGDGMEDSWESQFVSANAIATFLPWQDADGDGWTNLEEYLNKTNPKVGDDPMADVLSHVTGSLYTP